LFWSGGGGSDAMFGGVNIGVVNDISIFYYQVDASTI
jgi:hypothetical protein